jgi:hypothetical protein
VKFKALVELSQERSDAGLSTEWESGFKMIQGRFADWVNIKTNGKAFLVVDNITAIEKKGRFDHRAVYFLEIKRPV